MSQVVADLRRFGPERTGPVPTLRESERYCARLACSHYENFPVASWLVPARLRQHFQNIYAFCRWADDLGDETGDPKQSLSLLTWWRSELDRCYAGEVSHPVFVALRPTIEQFGIPRQPFVDLISAFVQDQTVTRYETFEQLHDYCRRSANPVGRLVLCLCEKQSSDMESLSDSICTGLQLANFWQDVARDARIGRIYIPREDLIRFGCPDFDGSRSSASPEFRELILFQTERARRFLSAGLPLGRMLPGRIGVEIDVITAGGLLILEEIDRIDGDVLSVRPTISKAKLLGAIGRAFVRRLIPSRASGT